jgi:methionyl-tRNA formyltransferase
VSLRIIFMGTPEFSVPTLNALHDAGHEIACVYSQPPRPAGRRGLELTKSPVHARAEELGMEVRTPVSLKSVEEQERFNALNADVAVVVAYGLLLPKPILEGARLGCYNGHASLLPRWRGAAPIHRAIMAGDLQSGIMVMKMEAGLDTGPVAKTAKVTISPEMTTGELHDILKNRGAQIMTEAMSALESGALTLTPQAEERVIYASKIDKAETRIDWQRTAPEVHNRIRSLSPFPGAWCEMEIAGKIERVKILRSKAAWEKRDGGLFADCADGVVELTELQRAGGKAMPAADFLRGVGPVKIS